PKCTWPTGNDAVLLWGHRPTTRRGEWVARKTGAAHIRVEDAFLRSLHPGRNGDAPLGLLIDHSACHFDSSRPSDLETILATAPLDDPALLNRAKDARTRITRAKLTKYAAVPWGAPCPDPGFILVVDQTRGDASIHKSGATDDTFHQMLSAAKAEHPNHRIVIKTHPETQAGFRGGHFDVNDVDDQVTLLDHAIAPTDLFVAAKAVYVVSSQLGFEAMLAGHKPVVFGQPFYCGWGLSDDRMPIPRRTRRLTVDQLCAAALILYPTWYDPCRDCLCELETVLDQLEAQTRDWRDDRHGWDAYGMRLWKRKSFQSFFGRQHPVRFEPKAPGPTRRSMVWGQKSAPVDAIRVEDGFLRSKGLGAQLIPPMSLVLDSLGIYFDPRTLSDLEVY
ncbi:MAG: capsular polysaccharide biosynthesis protein, partial [Planktomarina sp.]